MEIKKILEIKSQQINDYLKFYFNEIQKDVKYTEVLIEASKYSLFSNGKRLRPVLALLINDLFNSNKELILPLAGAIELIHTYSLIHDDLPAMDDDDLRRGKPTCHKKFDEATAILAGDALLTESFNMLTYLDTEPDIIVKIIKELSNASGFKGMVAGQIADMEAERITADSDMLDFIHRHKTGCLIEASVVLPGYVNKAAETEINYLKKFGKNIGLVFQIIDDILDVTADEKELGKPVGSDIENGKTTFVTLYGIDKAKVIAQDLIDESKEVIKKFNNNTEPLIELADYFIKRKK